MAKLTATHDEILRILDYKPDGLDVSIKYVAKCAGYDSGNYQDIRLIDEHLNDLRARKWVKETTWSSHEWERGFWRITKAGRNRINKLGRRAKKSDLPEIEGT